MDARPPDEVVPNTEMPGAFRKRRACRFCVVYRLYCPKSYSSSGTASPEPEPKV
uniref:Uncharacterized protein n=1 Tax=Planobispora rosea TaxID=35762 RepID=W0LRK7_PLARO|nr:hypothetical protein [Planobispora rosea]